jgi:L-lactate utilization protein LutC
MLFRADSILGPAAPEESARSELDEIFAVSKAGKASRSMAKELTARFIERVVEAGGEARLVEDWEAAAEWIAGLCGEGVILVAAQPDFREAGFAELLRRKAPALEIVPTPEGPLGDEDREALRKKAVVAAAGVGMAAAGFADSGAVLLVASRCEGRSLSLLPEAHVAILTESAITENLDSGAGRVSELLGAGGNSALTLVAGPSKTADIEKVLVTGVHGPRRFAVAVLRDARTDDGTTDAPVQAPRV